MPRKVFESFTRLDAADVNLYLSNEVTLTDSAATTYTVLTTDRYKTLRFTSASAVTVSVAVDTAFQPGERVDILQDGAGVVTITRLTGDITLAGRGVTATSYRIGQRYEVVSILCVDTNVYRIIGNATVD